MGKFVTEADEWTYGLTLDTSNLDDETGASDTTGWFCSLWFSPQEAAHLLDTFGVEAGYAIVQEDSQGFVSVSYYTSHSDWSDDWDDIVEMVHEAEAGE